MDSIIEGLRANDVARTLCIMGGEPLCEENLFITDMIITQVREKYPNQIIYIWTGYLYEDLLKSNNIRLQRILSSADYLVDGPYVDSLRDVRLCMKGSSNQRTIKLNDNL